MFNEVWWRGRLRRIAAAWREHRKLLVGNVSKETTCLRGAKTATDWREKRRTREFLKGLDLEDEEATALA